MSLFLSNFAILAQIAEQSKQGIESYVPLDFIWEQITTLTWLQAVLAISFGAVYMIYGCRIFRILVITAFGLVGMSAGIKLGQALGTSDWQIWGGVIGAVVLGAISIPLMRYAVSLLGAIAGGILTAGVWYAAGLPENYLIFAGALIGFIAGGMISFIIFDAAVILFTSLGGAVLVIVGCLSLLWNYNETSENVYDWVYSYKWFLPAAVAFATLVGVLVQRQIGKTKE